METFKILECLHRHYIEKNILCMEHLRKPKSSMKRVKCVIYYKYIFNKHILRLSDKHWYTGLHKHTHKYINDKNINNSI